MKIEAGEPEIIQGTLVPTRARLVVKIFADGEQCGEVVVLSGPLADIQDYVGGNASLAEIRARWRMAK